MESVFSARRVDGMAPIERAAVFVAVQVANQAIQFVPALASNGEPSHWYEYVFTLAAAIATGLASDLKMPLRIAVGTVVLTLDFHLFDMLFDRPNAFDWGPGVAGTVATILFTAALPWLDPPGALRRWCRRQSLGWAVYYPLAALLQFAGFWAVMLLIVAPIGVHTGAGSVLLLLAIAALATPCNFLLFANIRADARAASGGNVLFLRALDVLPNVEALAQLVNRLAPYRVVALDLDRRSADERGEGWMNAILDVITVALWIVLPFLLIVLLYDLSQHGFHMKTTGDLVMVVLIGLRLYVRSKKGGVSQQRLGRWSGLTRCVSPQTLDSMRERLGRDCGLAVIDLSREADLPEGEVAYLEKAKPGRTIVLLPESVSVPTAVQRLKAPVVRYGGGAPDLADRLRPVLDSLVPRQAVTK